MSIHFAIIAAGDGSRLASEGIATPKPLIDIDGRPMIRRLIDIFTACNAASVSVIVNEYMTEVQDYLRRLAAELPCPLQLVVKTTPGSMHSLAAVSATLPEDARFIVTTVDTMFKAENFEQYVREFDAQPRTDALMAVTTHIDDEKPLYVGVNHDGTVNGFYDQAQPDTDPQYVSAGIYGFGPKVRQVLDQAMQGDKVRMRDFQRALIAAGLDVRAYDLGRVMDVDHRTDIYKARIMLQGDSVDRSMQAILRAEAAAVAAIPVTDAYTKAVDLIVEHVHIRGGKLVTSGMGKAGQIAMNIATTFSSTGTPSVNLHPSEAQHGDLGLLRPDDVLLLISNSGKTTEIIQLVELAHRLYAGLPVIVITGKADSPLAQMADALLLTGDSPEVCPLGLTPTTSTTMMTVIGDVLVVNTMRMIGFTRAEYALRHHGGYLGQAARS